MSATLTTTTTTETPVALRPMRDMNIKELLSDPRQIAEIAKVMPAHCRPERMARVAITALTRTPMLAECDKASFFRCLMDLSQWGLEPDGRHAHLIPFRNNTKNIVECQLILDYKGLVELAYRSGKVSLIHADVVREGDIFDYNLGRIQRHTPWFLRNDADKPAKAGEIYAVFCFVEFLAGGAPKTEVMSKQEIDAVRSRSKAGKSGPWQTDYAEMAKKTVFRRASKWLPLSAEVVEAFDVDEDRLPPIQHAPRNRVGVSPLNEMIAGGFSHENGNGHAEPTDETHQGDAEADLPETLQADGEASMLGTFLRTIEDEANANNLLGVQSVYAQAEAVLDPPELEQVGAAINAATKRLRPRGTAANK